MQSDTVEDKLAHLETEFEKLEKGERVRFFYMYAKLLLDEQEMENLSKLLAEKA